MVEPTANFVTRSPPARADRIRIASAVLTLRSRPPESGKRSPRQHKPSRRSRSRSAAGGLPLRALRAPLTVARPARGNPVKAPFPHTTISAATARLRSDPVCRSRKHRYGLFPAGTQPNGLRKTARDDAGTLPSARSDRTWRRDCVLAASQVKRSRGRGARPRRPRRCPC